MGHLSWYRFSPQNKQTSAIFYNYEQIEYKHGNFQLISLSDRQVFYFILRHLSPWHRTETRHAPSLDHHSRALSFFSTITTTTTFFFLHAHFQFIVAVCVFLCSKKRRFLDKLHNVLWSIKTDVVYHILCFDRSILGYRFCHMETNSTDFVFSGYKLTILFMFWY